MHSETFKPLHFLLAILFGLLLCTNCPLRVDAILCRTGVDLLGGPAAECGPGHQCLNTTSALGQTVYSCDFGGICESILNLREGCVRDGQRMVCCCASLDGCNFGPGGPLPKVANQSRPLAGFSPSALKSSPALHFLKKLDAAGSNF